MNDLLLLVHRLPYPPNKGDKIRSYHLLQALATQFRVHLGCFVDDKNDVKYMSELNGVCGSTNLEILHPGRQLLRSTVGLMTGQPLSIPYYFSRPMAAWVSDTVEKHNVGVIVAYSSPMAQYVLPPEFGHCRRIMDFVDVDSDKWRQYGNRSAWPRSAVYFREARMLEKYERVIAANFDALTFVSQNEVELFDRISPTSQVKHFSVPNGVAADYFDPELDYSTPYEPASVPLVFTGMMDYWPNVDAVCWFARKVFPKIRNHERNAQFWIVGASPTREVRSLESIDGIHVTGRVPDVRPYLKHAKLVVAPLRISRGIQNKVLEAMAMGCTALSSPQAAAGLWNCYKAPIAIADGEAEYIDQAIGLISDAAMPLSPRNIRQYVLEHYDWRKNLSWFCSSDSPSRGE